MIRVVTDEHGGRGSAGGKDGIVDPDNFSAEVPEPGEEAASHPSLDTDASSTMSADRPWFRRPGVFVAIGLFAAALIASLFVAFGRDSPSISTGPVGKSIPAYFAENEITATPVERGEPGSPVISFSLPKGWSDAGSDTPDGAYGAAFYDKSVDPEYPPSVVVLLSRLSGDADPAKILEYAPGELEALPDYTAVSNPKATTMGGFAAIQLGGSYTRQDGVERIIAQKTVVIPAKDGLYVLQMNVDAPKDETTVLQEATASLDNEAKIVP